MDTPEYILVEVFQEIASAVKAALALPVLNYQYGYINELKETLIQYSKTPEFAVQKYPLLWLEQPFTIKRGRNDVYGEVEGGLRLFIIAGSTPTLKAKQRMEQIFKPIIHPIYRELLVQLNQCSGIQCEYGTRPHSYSDTYFWGEQQQASIPDVVDCGIISGLKIALNIPHNC